MEGTDRHRIRVAVWWCSRFITLEGNAVHGNYVNGLNRNNIPSIAVLQRADTFNPSARSMFLEVYTSMGIEDAVKKILSDYRLDRDEVVIVSDTGNKGMLDPEEVPLLYHRSAGVLGSEVPEVVEYRKAASMNESGECIRLLRQIHHRYRYGWALLELVDRLSVIDPEEAFALASKNVGGDPGMDMKLAIFHHMGIGTPKNPRKYLEHLMSAYTKGSYPSGQEWVEYVIDNRLESHYYEAVSMVQGADVRSKVNLARMYHGGLGLEKSIDRAIDLLRFAVSKGTGNAVNDLSDYLLERNGEGDVDEAFSILDAASTAGNLYSKVRLARMYRDGMGTDRDPLRACSLFMEASSLQVAREEMAGLARDMLLESLGMDVSEDRDAVLKKIDSLTDRAEKENAHMMLSRYDMGMMVSRFDGSVDDRSLEIAAFKGNKAACAEIARRARSEGDLDKAILYTRLSLSSDIGGDVNTLIDDLVRRGSPEDLSDAFVYAVRASGKGDAWSSWRLAKMYLDGTGVNKDLGKALELLKYASSRGVSPATEALRTIGGE
ncbi:MAG: hypothetical protein MJZ68_07090 [archaeon]|nr:hypothetical protein [archaeon]